MSNEANFIQQLPPRELTDDMRLVDLFELAAREDIDWDVEGESALTLLAAEWVEPAPAATAA